MDRIAFHTVWIAVPALLACGLIAGCNNKPDRDPNHTSFNAEPQPAADHNATESAESLEQLVRDLDAQSNRLPGENAQDYRQSMQHIFSDLSAIVPRLAGPDYNHVFAERVSVMDDSRVRLGSASQGWSAEPTVASGLRSAARALDDLARIERYHRADVDPMLAQLHARLDRLDESAGPLGQVDVANAVRLVTQIVGKLAGEAGAQALTANP
jgi:hypothetical protein